MAFGAGCNAQKGVVIVVTLGTGIGTAIFTDGHLVPNTEFGHMKIRGKDAEARASDAARQRKEMTWKKYAARLQEYLVEMENLFWPDLFIIGGGASKRADEFFPLLKIRTKIVPAQLLNQAGIIGAAVYASQQG
jgi:polyphosphate glucokinase